MQPQDETRQELVERNSGESKGNADLSVLQNVGEFEDHASEGQNHGSFFDLFAALEEDTATDDLIGRDGGGLQVCLRGCPVDCFL